MTDQRDTPWPSCLLAGKPLSTIRSEDTAAAQSSSRPGAEQAVRTAAAAADGDRQPSAADRDAGRALQEQEANASTSAAATDAAAAAAALQQARCALHSGANETLVSQHLEFAHVPSCDLVALF